jgi:hypothetical protein
MPTLFGVKGGQKFAKRVQKDNFLKSLIIGIKTKGGQKAESIPGQTQTHRIRVLLYR